MKQSLVTIEIDDEIISLEEYGGSYIRDVMSLRQEMNFLGVDFYIGLF